MKRLLFLVVFILLYIKTFAIWLLIPMDEKQNNHLKAYGITYWAIEQQLPAYWLLNYRGGSFLISYDKSLEDRCIIRGVNYEIISDAQKQAIFNYIARPDVNMDKVKLEKAPKIAVYAPPTYQPWDDAVMLVLTYAEIPYDRIYDEEILRGDLSKYQWLHLHHEDFTGQYGKFWAAYKNTQWYQNQVAKAEAEAYKLGYKKVSQLKLAVARTIRQYVANGGYLFAMCSATETMDIALAAHNTDICASVFDGDPADPQANQKLDYSQTFAFTNFKVITDPYIYAHSDIDVTSTRHVNENEDYFTLFDFSAKWDPIPTMLCQNHTRIIHGFMGQTTAFRRDKIKPSVLIMGEFKAAGEARYIHGTLGKGMWTFYGGHDPEDYRHMVGDPPTNLDLHPHSPGYRLILNNVLFPAAKKKKRKT